MTWVIAFQAVALVAVYVWGTRVQHQTSREESERMQDAYDRSLSIAIDTSKYLAQTFHEAEQHRYDEHMHRLDLEDRDRARVQELERAERMRAREVEMARATVAPVPIAARLQDMYDDTHLGDTPEWDPSPGLDPLQIWNMAEPPPDTSMGGYGEHLAGEHAVQAPREDIAVVPPGGTLIPEEPF